MGSTKPSPTKSLKNTRSSKVEDFVNVCFPSNRSAYSDPSFVKGIADSLLLSADYKRFADIGLVQIAKRSSAHIY